MAVRTVGQPLQRGTRKATPTIDTARHAAGLADAGTRIRALVARLTEGKDWLFAHGAGDPDRPEAERLWSDLAVQTHALLRDAYARFVLLRIAIGDEAALAAWHAALPDADALVALGFADLIRHFRERRTAPEWLTQEEARLVVQTIWPPQHGVDRIDGGVLDMVEEVPF